MHSPRNLADRSVRDGGVVQLVVLYWRSEVGDRARILIKSVMYAGARLWIARNISTRRGDRGWLSHGLVVTLPISYSLDGGALWGFTRDRRIAD